MTQPSLSPRSAPLAAARARQTPRSRALAIAGLLLVVAGLGCRSMSGPASASFASVTLENHEPAQIAEATRQVFTADGYRASRTSSGEMIFEKEASRATSISREGLVGAHEGAVTINRVRAEIVSAGTGTYRLQCKAYMVTGGSDPFFQDEVPLAHIRRGPYQALLNKVAQELKSGAPAAP